MMPFNSMLTFILCFQNCLLPFQQRTKTGLLGRTAEALTRAMNANGVSFNVVHCFTLHQANSTLE